MAIQVVHMGPYRLGGASVRLMFWQPRPRAETSSPRLPSCRFFISLMRAGIAPARRPRNGHDLHAAFRKPSRYAAPRQPFSFSRATSTNALSAGETCDRFGKYR
jgi:hypothetical protein